MVHAVSHLVAVHEPLEHSTAVAHVAPPAFFGVHDFGIAAMSQKLVLTQSASEAHTFPHAPVATLQIVPACDAPVVQSAFAVHLPQVPSPLE